MTQFIFTKEFYKFYKWYVYTSSIYIVLKFKNQNEKKDLMKKIIEKKAYNLYILRNGKKKRWENKLNL